MDDTAGRDSGGTLVGRTAELAALTRLLDAAATGHPALAAVTGPSGIGKTALIDHALTLRENLDVVRVRGVRWESEIPLGVARQLDPRCAGELDATAVVAGERLHATWAARSARDSHPVVVVVDDAHWADTESLQALRTAVRRMTDERVLVLLAAVDDRPGDLTAEALDFWESCRDDVLPVGPLNAEDLRAFAARAHGTALSRPAARHLAAHTGGNPLHTGRLLRELPAKTWQDWQPELPAPARFAAAVRTRLDRCGPEARTLVEASSVLDDGTSLETAWALACPCAEAAPGEEDSQAHPHPLPLPALDEACAAGLLVVSAGPGRALLSFPDPLTRAAVRDAVPLTRRTDLHRRAAHLVADRGRALRHRIFAASVADAQLADELEEFAAEEAAAGAWSSVADTLIKASRLTPESALRQDRMLRATDALVGAGEVAHAATFAPELSSFPPRPLRDAVLGYLAIMRGRAGEAETLLAQAWDHCDPAREPDLAGVISQRRVLHALGRWDPADIVTWARRALGLAAADSPSGIEAEAVLGLGLAAMGRTAEAVAVYEAAAVELPTGAQIQRFQLGRGWVDLAALDAPESALRRLEAAVPTGFRMGSVRISLWAQGWLARTQFTMGAWDDALETVERAAAQLAEVRMEIMRPLVHWTGAQINALRGDWPAAERHLGRAAGLHHYEAMRIPACLAAAQVAEARGAYDRVLDALAPVARADRREGLDEPGFWPWQDIYANALVMVGRASDADAFLRPHEELAAARGHRSTQARLGLARGRVAGTDGDIGAARAHFEEALAHLAPLPLPYDTARVSYAYGQTLRRAGKRREADAVLRRARDGYAQLGAHTYVARCDRELHAGGLNSRRAEPGSQDRLTAQEQAVARLVAGGLSNQETAAELFISVKTVQYHLTHIYTKLGIRSRSELAALSRD
ncbi:LuxR family transcriptional regulator [Streptomyces antnestii]|uniref:LuxR family transcriptional regulator n=1 Tax=Streptomyces antnestii TaxID=2494256 RepID=A0A437PZQ8_9ACTN|nr:LuxR family transcriptional regulator [Streptomyces sp. San01]RVU27737.1 LuxR family transcriptional regulator [Streptomyces sp. San01]